MRLLTGSINRDYSTFSALSRYPTVLLKEAITIVAGVLFSFASPAFSQSPQVKSPDVSLSSLVADHRIIFLGETNHGVSQQYALIANFCQEMFAKAGFELLQSESSFCKTYVALFKNEKPSVEGLSMIYRNSEEFSSFVDFARQDQIGHAGFDPQVVISEQDINFIVNQFALSPVDQEIFQAGLTKLNTNIPPPDTFIKLCKALLKKNRKEALKHQLFVNLLWASEILAQTADLQAAEFKAFHSDYRDHAMAMNFLFWDTYFKRKRTIAIGASAHLSYGFDRIDNVELRLFVPMGKTVKQHILQHDMINIALSVKNGKWKGLNDTKPSYFPTAVKALEYGHSHYPVLLSTDSLRHHISLVLGEKPVYGDWSGSFDYIVVFENVTPVSHRIIKTQLSMYEGSAKQAFFSLRDEITGSAIEFAHIYFPGKQKGTTSNDEGLFVIKNPKQYAGSEMIISRIGYQSKTISFPSDIQDTAVIKLGSNVHLLNELVVSGKVLTPLAIMQKVKNRLASMEYLPQLNYYHIISRVNDNIDTLQNESIVQFLFEPGKGIERTDILTRKKLKRSLYNKFKANLSYPFVGVEWTYPTVLKLFRHDARKMSKYFSLHQTRGAHQLIRIHFKALNTAPKATGLSHVSSYEGAIWIDESSYLPIKIELIIKTDKAGEFQFSTDFDVKKNTLVSVFTQHNHTFPAGMDSDHPVVLEETSTWLKQQFVKEGDLIPRTSHDMLLIAPDQKIWDRFNEFIR